MAFGKQFYRAVDDDELQVSFQRDGHLSIKRLLLPLYYPLDTIVMRSTLKIRRIIRHALRVARG